MALEKERAGRLYILSSLLICLWAIYKHTYTKEDILSEYHKSYRRNLPINKNHFLFTIFLIIVLLKLLWTYLVERPNFFVTHNWRLLWEIKDSLPKLLAISSHIDSYQTIYPPFSFPENQSPWFRPKKQ